MVKYPALPILLAYLALAQIIDVAATSILIGRGWEEINLIAKWLIDTGGYFLLLVVKLCTVLLLWHVRDKLALWHIQVLAVVAGMYLALNLYQIRGILI